MNINITHQELVNNAIWNVARRKGYRSAFGSTGCNVLFGAPKVATADGNIFHDSSKNFSTFDYMLPAGDFFHSDSRTCPSFGFKVHFKEAQNAKDILHCDGNGPYHQEFLERCKSLTQNTEKPLLTFVHLFETHGAD